MKSAVIVTSAKLKTPFLRVYFVTMSIESKRGRKKLSIDEFLYVFDEYSSDRVTPFWRCERKSDGCRARLRIYGDDTKKKMNRHSH